jgi:hypothetical protein
MRSMLRMLEPSASALTAAIFFSIGKRLENFKAAIGLYFGYYNLVKIHNTLALRQQWLPELCRACGQWPI